jgi:hypothetical protein
MPEGMTLAEYGALYDAIVHMSLDFEDLVPRPSDLEWDEVAAAKYALVKQMIDTLTDSCCAGVIDYYVKRGLILPEVDTDFSGDEPRTTINGVVID